MRMARRDFVAGALAASVIAPPATAQEWGPPSPADGDPDKPFWPPRETIPLWPSDPPGFGGQTIARDWTMNGPPGSRQLWIRGVPRPEINVFRPADPDGSALLVLPGGGYGFLSVENEGLHAAQRFNADRITVFILTYRLPGEGWERRHLVPLQDAQRAMRLIRARAQDFGIDPDRLGVLGFSAGGHLAADLCVAHSEATYSPLDDADRLSARPAYAGLVYPLVTLEPGRSESRSLDQLLGQDPPPDLVRQRSPLTRISAATPPNFLVHAIDDPTVPVAHSQLWLAACLASRVPCEAHIFSEGGHGFGLSLPPDRPGSRWPDLFAAWLRRNGG